MLDPRISALEEDLDEVESSEEEDEEEEKVPTSTQPRTPPLEEAGVTMFLGVLIHSQSDSRPPNRTDAVTVTTTGRGGRRRRATDAVARPDGLFLSHVCSEPSRT